MSNKSSVTWHTLLADAGLLEERRNREQGVQQQDWGGFQPSGKGSESSYSNLSGEIVMPAYSVLFFFSIHFEKH